MSLGIDINNIANTKVQCELSVVHFKNLNDVAFVVCFSKSVKIGLKSLAFSINTLISRCEI